MIWTEHDQITQDACSAFCNGSHMRDFDIVSAFFFRYSRSATWKLAAKCTKLFQGLDEFGVISHGPQHNHFHSLRSFGCQFLAGLTYLVQRIAPGTISSKVFSGISVGWISSTFRGCTSVAGAGDEGPEPAGSLDELPLPALRALVARRLGLRLGRVALHCSRASV